METLENQQARVILKKGRAKSALNRHPWIFSGAIDRVEGGCEGGEIVPVYSAEKRLLGKGFFNPRSQIRVRLLSFEDGPVGREFFQRRIQQALELREKLIPAHTTACRLLHSEGDFLPGVVVDCYGEVLAAQFSSLGMAKLKPLMVEILRELLHPAAIIERSEGASLQEEGLAPVKQLLFGEQPGLVEILENDIRFRVDVLEGQKTGFYLDQRDNRRLIGELAAGNKTVLNCFSYTGGFSVYAALRGAATTSVDASEAALALAKENFGLNGLNPEDHRFIPGNVFEFLREPPQSYDVIILDPPAFVKHKKDLEKAARGYKDINRLAIKQVNSGGLLLTCSCSHFLNRDLFRKIVFSAAQEASRNVQILAQPGQPPDHPVNIFHPEGEYLKTLLLRVFD